MYGSMWARVSIMPVFVRLLDMDTVHVAVREYKNEYWTLVVVVGTFRFR